MNDADSAEEVIFNAARQFENPGKRRQYLDLACEGNPELRQRIERLLATSGEADAFFGRKAAFSAQVVAPALAQAPAPTPAATPLTEQPGTRIGRYKLLEQIGEGGFGVVFMAEQQEPIRRRVALKLIKLGMDTKLVLARFEAERQALALMDHPNIARVLDGGATDSGRPFFVMELVQGVPITGFCDQNQLDARERVRLFISVCQAIQSAHQKGIIHRDLKPTNILVTLNPDGSGFPKVIDFGVAKATDQKLTEKTLFTLYGMMIGTPAYMSPEQAQMSHLDVDTRADIYSLGALLYELLTGTPPFPEQRLRGAGYNEMQRIILEEQPERPSTRLSTLQGERRSVVARNRSVSELTLGRAFPDDLDWIVMKCLEKDRARRYETANGLARDLERHLNNEPVVARPPTATYRLKKFVDRNRLSVTAAGIVAMALVVGLCASTWEAVRARQAEREQGRLRVAENAQRQRAEEGERLGKRLFYAGKMNMAQVAWEQDRVAELRAVLEETADYEDRGFEWYYWQRQTHLELRTLRGHQDEVNAVAHSPDGQRIVTGSLDTTAKVWDAATGKELFPLKGHLHGVLSVAFSRDGQRIVTGSMDATAKIWDATSGKELVTLEGHTGQIQTVAFSSDGQRVVTACYDGMAKAWDAVRGKELLTLHGHTGRIECAAFSPDDRWILTAGDDQTVRISDAVTGKEVLSFKAHSGAVWDARYSPDGQRIVTCGDDRDPTAKVWDAGTGNLLLTLAGHRRRISTVRFSPDSHRVATASNDGTAKVWEAATGKELFTIKGHSEGLEDLAFSPDSQRIVTASADRTAKIWDANGDREVLTLKGHAGGILAAVFSPKGKLVATGSWDQTARLWDTTSGSFLREFPTQNGAIQCVAFSPDGRRIATGGQTAKVWDAANGQPLFPLAGHIGALSRLAFSRDGHWILTGGVDKTARLWEADTGKPLMTLRGHTGGVLGVAFSPDGRRVVTASADQTAKVWDLATTNVLCTLRGHSDAILSIAFSPDGQRILTGSGDHTARLWDASAGTNLLILKGHIGVVSSVNFSPDGRRLLTGSWDQTAKVWDAVSGAELLTLKGHADNVTSVAFSPDGRRVLTGSRDATAKVWDAATPDQVTAWQAEEKDAQEREAMLVRQQAAADERIRASTALDPGAIKQWLVLGPLTFAGGTGAEAMAQEQIVNEPQLRPSVGQRSQAGGSIWTWQVVELDDYRINFVRVFRTAPPSAVAYLACYIQSDVDRADVSMKVGSVNQSKVYLNAKELYRYERPRRFVADQDVVSGVNLKAGTNILLFKVVFNEEVEWRASLRFTDSAGHPLKGIGVTLSPP